MQTTATMVPKSTAAPMARRVTSRASIPISILEGDKEDFRGKLRISCKLYADSLSSSSSRRELSKVHADVGPKCLR